MAWVTATTPFSGFGAVICSEDSNDQLYIPIWAGRRLYWGTGGNPNGVLTGNKAGDLCWDDTTFKYYTCSTDLSTTWVVIN